MYIIRAQETNFNNLRYFSSSKIIPPTFNLKVLAMEYSPSFLFLYSSALSIFFSHSSLNIDARPHNKKFRQPDTRLDGGGGGEVLLNPRIDFSMLYNFGKYYILPQSGYLYYPGR